MKLKKDIELAQIKAKQMMNEASKPEDKEYYKGLYHALNWICWNKQHGIDDLPLK